MLNKIVVFIIFVSSLCSCSTETKPKKSSVKPGDSRQPDEATGFVIQQLNGYQKLTVFDPWQKSSDNQFDYYLIEKGKEIPPALKNQSIFYTPLQKVVCLSTTHIGYLDALNEIVTVIGLSGSAYLTNIIVKKGIAENHIREVGNERGLNYEMIVQLKPDVVFAYGVGSEINAQMNKLRDLGIPVVLVGEYLEQTPLGKAEWIKFFGAFFNKKVQADSIYERIRNNYINIKRSVSDLKVKPTVLTGLPFKDTWWIAGGQSNLAVLIEDAGGKFLWGENQSKEAFPVSLEEVFLRAASADFWINCGSVNNLNELLAFDRRFSVLPAVKNSKVFNNNLHSTPAGGNDYWESGVINPDLILSDLVKIFHPEVAAGKEFYYYKKLKND
jgi:iron complex transport system substrate-binding protein